MKTKFLAGLIATIISIIVVVGLSLFLTLVLDVEPSKNWFTITAAFATIASWLGVYKWLEPKGEVEKDQYGFDIKSGVKEIDATVFKATYLRTSKKTFRIGLYFMIISVASVVCILQLLKNHLLARPLEVLSLCQYLHYWAY